MKMILSPTFWCLRVLGVAWASGMLVLGLVVLLVLMLSGGSLATVAVIMVVWGYLATGMLLSLYYDLDVLNQMLVGRQSVDHARIDAEFTGALTPLDVSLLSSDSRNRRDREEFKDAVSEIGYSAAELSHSAEKLSENIGQQSQATGSIAAAITEISHSIEEIASRMHQAYEAAETSQSEGRRGAERIRQVSQKMEEVAEYIERTYTLLASLEEKTIKVSSISSVIRSIAEQTNLLALNAAIEAARAGEHGRGFAVVAEEVRALATRSHTSSQEITANIEEVQETMQELKGGMASVVSRAEETVGLSGESDQILQGIAAHTAGVSEQLSAIREASDQQHLASREISASIEEVALMADENSRLATQSSGIAKHLYTLCQKEV